MADIPVLFSKTKLKTLNFATNLSSIFNNFEEEATSVHKPPVLKNNVNVGKENSKLQGTKRTRENCSDDENESLPNKTKKIEPQFEERLEKSKKPTIINDSNFRRLNMKTFKSKGYRGGTSKGTKFKRFQWAKNKNKNKLNAKYGVGNDEETNDVNYNLLHDDSEEKPIMEQEEEVVDDMSAEAQFARLKKPQEQETKKVDKKKSNLPKESPDHKRKEPKLDKNQNESIVKKKEIIKQKQNVEKKSQTNKKNQNKTIEEDIVENYAKKIIEEHFDEDENLVDNCGMACKDDQLKPLFPVDENGNVLHKLPDYAFKILEKDFGHKNFKKHQQEAIIRIASGLSTLAILSTGYGKSLIYQFATMLYVKKYPGSLVLVVSPLISLMQDQLHNLSKSLRAASCDSTMSEKEFEFLVQDINNGKIDILYMSPEAIINKKIKSLPQLAFVCIDEVHCLSQWSHNFRPSYLQLCKILFDFYNAKCILGLTATATDSSIEEIRSYFDIDKRNIIKDCDLPENLSISVTKDINKEQALIELLKSSEFKPFFNHVIIYCSRREQTEKLAQMLRMSLYSYKKKFDLDMYSKMERKSKNSDKKKPKKEDKEINEEDIAEAYHAGLSFQQRKRIQNQFIKGKLKIIVATLAFGMGINMPNIRAVIHFNMPKSIENYVQEIGRAGRDGKKSLCHLFLENQREDINEIKKYIHMNGYDQLTIKKLLAKIFSECDSEKCKNNTNFLHHVALPISDMIDYLDIKEETILTLLCYLEAANHIKIFSNCFKSCTLTSYKGIDYLKQVSKTNEFLAKILELHCKNSKSPIEENEIKIDMIDLCEKSNENYDIIRQKLRRLEWQLDDSGNYKSKSGVKLQFSNQSFYLKRKCLFKDSELDEINDMLWKRVDTQMKFSYANFKSLYKLLSDKAYTNIGNFISNFDLKIEDNGDTIKSDKHIGDSDESDFEEKLELCSNSEEKTKEDLNQKFLSLKSNMLKQKLNQYFNSEFDIFEYIKEYHFECESQASSLSREHDQKRLVADIKKFIFNYQSDFKLNGSIIARIFHGIGTPRFPAEIWGRNRIFWRCHLDFDFEHIVKIATQQLLNF